jgi:uncharacterized protein (DUF1501 family)
MNLHAMKRRELIRNLLGASAFAASTPLTSLAAPQCAPVNMERTIVNVMLQGAADLRFLLMPKPGALDPAHEELLWDSRRMLYAAHRNDGAAYADVFEQSYDVPAGQDFGVHKRCGWLTSQFEAGRVAIVANAYCSRNRRHDQSILNADAGDPEFGALMHDRDGWGGRLVEYIGPGANAVELGGSISVFNKGSQSGKRFAQVVHAQNMRDISLPDVEDGGRASNRRDIIVRALKGYYSARTPEVRADKPGDWPYHAFFNHNEAFRQFGGKIARRLQECGGLPATLLPASAGGDFALSSGGFAQQCRNLYDACLAPDLLGVRALSMGYGGWDTHGDEELRAGANLEDIFGADKGLDRASREIAAIGSDAADRLTFYFASDFGRQLVTNGDFGTDHGRGTYTMVIGPDVRGGIYGEMFPVLETVETDGKIPLKRHGADILGQTSTLNILREVVEWAYPGAAAHVFPHAEPSALEAGVSLQNLMAA